MTKEEILEQIKSESEKEYPIWPNKFKDKDEWLPEEIKKLERRAYSAGASRALELAMEEMKSLKEDDDDSDEIEFIPCSKCDDWG